MPTSSTPESRALLAVYVVVLASLALHTVFQAFDRLETANAEARSAINAAHELQEKIEEFENELEELRDEMDELR